MKKEGNSQKKNWIEKLKVGIYERNKIKTFFFNLTLACLSIWRTNQVLSGPRKIMKKHNDWFSHMARVTMGCISLSLLAQCSLALIPARFIPCLETFLYFVFKFNLNFWVISSFVLCLVELFYLKISIVISRRSSFIRFQVIISSHQKIKSNYFFK